MRPPQAERHRHDEPADREDVAATGAGRARSRQASDDDGGPRTRVALALGVALAPAAGRVAWSGVTMLMTPLLRTGSAPATPAGPA